MAAAAAAHCFNGYRARSQSGYCANQSKIPFRLAVRSDLDSNVSDMRVNAPKGLFPSEPEPYLGPKLKVAITGAGLAAMSTAIELLDQGHEVDIYESRSFIDGKLGSFVDRKGNHIEMGLHFFFGCYNNLLRLLEKVGADKNLLVKDHTHTFVNKGADIELDFCFQSEPLHGIRAFLTTNQLETVDKARNALALALSPFVRALVDPDGATRDIRDLDNTEASLLRMLKGSPDVYLSGRSQTGEADFILDGDAEKSCMIDRSSDGGIYVTGLAFSNFVPGFVFWY